MARAAPTEQLQFSAVAPLREGSAKSQPELTARQLKKQKEALMVFRQQLHDRLAKRRAASKESEPVPAPRYDEVFAQAAQWLDERYAEVQELKGEIRFPDDIWKDPWREPDDS
jgi:hypothetical protein